MNINSLVELHFKNVDQLMNLSGDLTTAEAMAMYKNGEWETPSRMSDLTKILANSKNMDHLNAMLKKLQAEYPLSKYPKAT